MQVWLEIKDYAEVFSLKEAEYAKEVTWTKFPVARNSTSYRRLMKSPAGRSAFCVFIGILRMVARGKTNGRLTLKGRAITVEDIEAETGIPARSVVEGLDYLKSPAIGWILPCDPPVSNPPSSGQSPDSARLKTGVGPVPSRASASESSSLSSSSPSLPSGESERGLPPQSDFPQNPGLTGEWDNSTLWRCISLYPKRCKRGKALRAVQAALVRLIRRGQKDPTGFLESKTAEYAAAVDGQAAQFIPDPHNWLDNEQYDDDPATWKRDENDDAPTTAIGKGGF